MDVFPQDEEANEENNNNNKYGGKKPFQNNGMPPPGMVPKKKISQDKVQMMKWKKQNLTQQQLKLKERCGGKI